MKALIFSDPHLTNKNIKHDENGEIYFPVFDKILEIAQAEEVDYIFNLGDTFHTKDNVQNTLLAVYRNFLLTATKLGFKVIQLVGNHDFARDDYKYHSLQNFEHIPNVTTVDKYFKLGNNFFVSYCREKERLFDFLKEAGGCTRLFGHLDLNGFSLGDDYIEKHAEINPEDLKFEQIISGHYHEPQDKMIGESEFYYVGSPSTIDFGESDQEKRVLILDLDDGYIDSIPTDMTFHRNFKIKANEPFPEINEHPDHHYRVVVEGTKEELSVMEKPNNYPAKIIEKYVASDKKRIDLKIEDTHENILKTYIKEELKKNFPNHSYSLEELEKFGRRYINLAKG
jgi:DNA repair exonuclease SbcCD nuclease subunit